jgi:ABC-2 type transport system ATP-binding protein
VEHSDGSLIEARGLTRMYGTVVGLNDVTLDLPRGIHGLLGPNGAGKSTFLKLITGQLRPTEGTIRVLGQDPWNNPELFRRIGYCPEQDSLYPFLSAREFVTLLAEMGGDDPARARARAERALAEVGAGPFMDKKIGEYSRGMRQRTKVAQALVHEPEFLILDEPLTGTDPIGRREMIDLIQVLGRGERSILVSSHVMHEVQATTQSFLLIWRGRVLASGQVREIRALMDEIPHRITLRTSRARELAQRLIEHQGVQGVDVRAERGEVRVRTRDPRGFYEALPQAAASAGALIGEMVSQDDSLEAVFGYLIGADSAGADQD